jgi:antitoxin VapB
MTSRARVFWSGRSQAVRLPKAFRLSVAEVEIRREGDCLVLEPLLVSRDAKGWPEAFWALAGAAPEFSIGRRPRRHERGNVLRRRS